MGITPHLVDSLDRIPSCSIFTMIESPALFTASITLGSYVGILWRIFMASYAMCYAGISRRNGISTQNVFAVSDYFKMIGICTAAISTSMIWFESVWNLLCMMIFPREAMDVDIANLSVYLAHKKDSIARACLGSHPIPTSCGRINFNLFKEAFNDRSELIGHLRSIA